MTEHDDSPQMAEPQTSAGRALLDLDYGLDDPRANDGWFSRNRVEYARRIVAIEREAVAAWLASPEAERTCQRCHRPSTKPTDDDPVAALADALWAADDMPETAWGVEFRERAEAIIAALPTGWHLASTPSKEVVDA